MTSAIKPTNDQNRRKLLLESMPKFISAMKGCLFHCSVIYRHDYIYLYCTCSIKYITYIYILYIVLNITHYNNMPRTYSSLFNVHWALETSVHKAI
jgi:hypothetical protein